MTYKQLKDYLWHFLWLKLWWLGLNSSLKKSIALLRLTSAFFFPLLPFKLKSLEFFSLPFNKVSKGLQLKTIFEVAFQILDWAQETNFCISLNWSCWFISWPCETGTESREMNIKLLHSVPQIFDHFNAFLIKKPPLNQPPTFYIIRDLKKLREW